MFSLGESSIGLSFLFVHSRTSTILLLSLVDLFNFFHSLVQICDMVSIARYLNVTLIVPELDKTSFWADPRCVSRQFPYVQKVLNDDGYIFDLTLHAV